MLFLTFAKIRFLSKSQQGFVDADDKDGNRNFLLFIDPTEESGVFGVNVKDKERLADFESKIVGVESEGEAESGEQRAENLETENGERRTESEMGVESGGEEETGTNVSDDGNGEAALSDMPMRKVVRQQSVDVLDKNGNPKRDKRGNKVKKRQTIEETVPDWYAVPEERTHDYIFNELGIDGALGRQLIRNNADAVAKEIEDLKKKQPVMGTNPIAYKAAMEDYNNKLQALQNQAAYWRKVKQLQDDIDEAEERELRKRRREEAQAARERADARYKEEMERRKAMIEEKERQKKDKMNAALAAIEGFEEIPNVDFPIEEDAEAMEVMNDTSPQKLEEVAASLLASGKVKLIPSDTREHTGYGTADMKKMPFIFANAENGGVSPEHFGELVEEEARNEHIVFPNNTNGFNALLNVLGEVQSMGDIKNYIKNARTARAEEIHSENVRKLASVQAEDRWIEQHGGMSREEYANYIAWVEDAVEKNKREITNEEFNQLFNYTEYDTRTTTTDEGSDQRGAEKSSTDESEARQADATSDDTRGDGESGKQKAESGESASPVAEAIARQEVNENPTEGQKEAGNYKKAHVRFDGYDLTIENKKGSTRSGVDPNGKEWSQTMHNDYGYILGTEGVDGDHIDVFLSDTPEQGEVFVVDQVDPTTGKFDEHKVMYGFPDMESAREAYLSNYEDGWQGLGVITQVSREEFKKWVDSSHRKTKPFAEYKSVKAEGGQNEGVIKTAADVEAGGAVVDKLQSMGVDVSTDMAENRRVRKQAEQDKSEAGQIHDLKTTDGKVYGYTYRGGIYLDPRKIDAELPLHEYGHLWTEAFRILNPEGWSEVVETIKGDTEGWNMVREMYPDLKSDSEIADEVIATFSGKKGAERLKEELERMAAKNPDYKSRWGNIYNNIVKAIQDFWKKIGYFLGIKYETPEQVYDQVLKDFASGMNPRARVEEYLKERDAEYTAAVERGDEAKAKELFDAALRENIGNGITPYVAVGKYRGDMDRLARGVKSRDPKIIAEVADLMAPIIPENAVLVPAPSHSGEATDMLDVANAIAERTGAPVANVLRGVERGSQREAKREGAPITSGEMGITMEGELPEGKTPVVIDNVVNSGNTAEACVKALGKGVVASLADAADRYRHVASLKSAAAVVRDKNGKVVPLSKRFEMGGSGYLAKQKGEGGAVEFTPEQKATQKALDEMLGGILGKDYVVDAEEGQRVLDEYRELAKLQKEWLAALSNAETFIEQSLKNENKEDKVVVDLPKSTRIKIRRVMGREYDSHNIDAKGIRHARNSHGMKGDNLEPNSIPLRDEDFKLAPYIMVSPDRIERGSTDASGRESIRFYKDLANGYVVVVEKEEKDSPDDMGTINMWAEKSSRVADARKNKPLQSTSTPANNALETKGQESNAVTVITSIDAAKIRKDAETTIEKENKLSMQKAVNAWYYSNAMRAVEDIKQEKATAEQWLKMIEKAGGLKAGEDKWTGLSEWLRGNGERRTENGKPVMLTKQEVMDYIKENAIEIEDVEYEEGVDIDNNPQMQKFREEFDAIKQQNKGERSDLEVELDKFEDEMYDKYGSGWYNKLNDEEIERAEKFDSLSSTEGTSDEKAFREMVERYGEDFSMAFEVDGNGVLVPLNDPYNDSGVTGQAEYFLELDKRPINSTRLNYTTDFLDNKREIALVVPSIEPWNVTDDVHFGDAGNGRAVAWVRFGETYTKDTREQNKAIGVKYIGQELKSDIDKEAADYIILNWGEGNDVSKDRQFVFAKSMAENALNDNMPYVSEEQQRHYKELLAALNKFKKEDFEAQYDNGERVLVIDEIQSKRHQEGREKGYKKNGAQDAVTKANIKRIEAQASYDIYVSDLAKKYDCERDDIYSNANDAEIAQVEEYKKAVENAEASYEKAYQDNNGVPDAPFDKNWHEVAFKRMLRYAAENGYDKVAWTTGEQQTDRYDLSKSIKDMTATGWTDYSALRGDDAKEAKLIAINTIDGDEYDKLLVDKSGKVLWDVYDEFEGKQLSDIVGKDLAKRLMEDG